MQSYSEIRKGEDISKTWARFKTNDLTIMSNNSGASFPVLNTEIGMFCYRSDEKKLYTLTGFNDYSGEPEWELALDFNTNISGTVVDRGEVASKFDFDNYVQSGIYKIYLTDSDWGDTSHRPNYVDPVSSNVTYANDNGLLSVFNSDDSVYQVYADVENGDIYTRVRDDDSQWSNWERSWTERNLTKVSQLLNDSKYISGINANDVVKALGYTPLNSAKVNTTGGSPVWDNTSIVVDGSGIVDIGRYIRFHPSTASTTVTVTLDGGASGQNLALYKTSASTSSPANFLCYGDVTAFSDERLKTDIKVIENAVNKVRQLRGVTFKRKDLPKKSPRQTGIIAQDLKKVLPEAVRSVPKVEKVGVTPDEYLTVAYGNVIGLLVEAIKEQQTMIEKIAKAVGVELVEKPKKTVKKKPAAKVEPEPAKAEKPKTKATRTRKRAE